MEDPDYLIDKRLKWSNKIVGGWSQPSVFPLWQWNQYVIKNLGIDNMKIFQESNNE
jgi:hypothetical protein